MNTVITRLKKLESDEFNGCIKIGIENSVLNSIVLTNRTELPTSDIKADFMPEKFIPTIQFGSVVYEFENGKIVKYAYSKIYRANTLREFLAK